VDRETDSCLGEQGLNREVDMRQAMVDVKTRRQARRAMPWAAVIIKVEGGYRGFESHDDARTWKNQK